MTPTHGATLYSLAESGIVDRTIAINAAADALAAGRLVVLPTETVYGVAGSAASPSAAAALTLATSKNGSSPRPFAWHVHSAELVRDLLKPTSPVHRRLLSRLLPGPVTLQVELPEPELQRIQERSHAAAGLIQDGSMLAIRVPDHPIAHDILESAWKKGHPVIAQGISSMGSVWGDGSRLPSDRYASDPALAVMVDDGPTRYRRPSTAIRLLAGGGYRIVSEGALEARMVKKQVERTILFVCTGNTCRSPMAAAIGRHVAGQQVAGPAVATKFLSAGTAADDGSPATAETLRAVESLGIDPASLKSHRSHELTRQLLAEAEVVYAMTASHARSAAAVDPSAAAKIKLLDPDGHDIPDPIGGTQEVYTRTAERLRDLIQRRLTELDA